MSGPLFSPRQPEPAAKVAAGPEWGDCPATERHLYESGDGNVYPICGLAIGYPLPTPVALATLLDYLWPDEWDLIPPS